MRPITLEQVVSGRPITTPLVHLEIRAIAVENVPVVIAALTELVEAFGTDQ